MERAAKELEGQLEAERIKHCEEKVELMERFFNI